jgi:predicted dehydrogenase
MRGFRLSLGHRPAIALTPIAVADPADRQFPADGRIAPVSRLVSAFLNAVETGRAAKPGFGEGLRVQSLLDKARQSNDLGRRVAAEP